MQYLFAQVAALKGEAARRGMTPPEFSIKISFLELYRDQFRDLFDRARGNNEASNVRVRDEKDEHGNVQVVITGVEQIEVGSADELLDYMRRGSLARVTGATVMNAASSRSHAIVTIYVSHRREVRRSDAAGSSTLSRTISSSSAADGDDDGDAGDDDANAVVDIVTTTSKFNFVDLAGSERLKRTQAEGERAKEGININQGLFVLGNVISALGDPSKKSSFVP